jgi:hypothetical protein
MLTVTPAILMVQADDKSRAYGQTNPVFTATLSGFVNGEGSSVISGSMAFSTDAETNSPVGAYAIAVTGLASTNYSLTFSNGTLTITAAATITSLSSSTNPAAQGATVTFTATVGAVAPVTQTPAGGVQFLTNGVPCGTPIALASGLATLQIGLPVGTNSVTAIYPGDENFLPSTNELAQIVNAVVAAPPAILAIRDNNDGTITVTFTGTPGSQYLIQATANLSAPSAWAIVATNTAGPDGSCTFTDSKTTQPQRFYRALSP